MENLTKSIDSYLDDLFAEDESVEKSMLKDAKPSKETADEVKPGEKSQDDDKRGAGRPKQISDVPKTDTDGKRAKDYDDDIAEKNEDGKKKEDTQVKPGKEMKKSEISEEEYAEFQAFKKSQAEAAKAEELKKAETAQSDLIKSAVIEATKGIREENESLRKSLEEQSELVKAMANKPQRKKSVTNVAALEKSGNVESSQDVSPAEMKAVALDVAEDLVKSQKLSMDHAIELENTGYIYEAEPRRILENAVKETLNKRYR